MVVETYKWTNHLTRRCDMTAEVEEMWSDRAPLEGYCNYAQTHLFNWMIGRMSNPRLQNQT